MHPYCCADRFAPDAAMPVPCFHRRIPPLHRREDVKTEQIKTGGQLRAVLRLSHMCSSIHCTNAARWLASMRDTNSAICRTYCSISSLVLSSLSILSPWFRQRGLIIIELLRIHWNLPLMIVYAAPVIICMNRGDHRAAVYPLPQGNGRNAILSELRREAGAEPQGKAHPRQRDRHGIQAGADVDGHGCAWLLSG